MTREVTTVDEFTKDLQDRFGDAAIALFMEDWAQDSGEALLRQFQDSKESMPPELDRHCRKTIQKSYKHMLIGSTLKCAARAVACCLLVLCLLFPLAMSVEAFRIPVINFVLKHGNGFLELTFSQSSDSFNSLDSLRMAIWPSIPPEYEFVTEKVGTAHSRGVEYVTSLLVRYQNQDGGKLDIFVSKAAGTTNIDAKDAKTTPMDLYGQQAILVAGENLRVLWVNEDQGQLYDVVGYNTGPDDFWACVHTLAQATQVAGTNICF